MPADRLSPLDVSFLAVERSRAPMHVGWAAVLDPPEDGPQPGYRELADHIASRLGGAPRFLQRLAKVPLGVHDPEWVDDPAFDPAEHLLPSDAIDLGELVDAVMSTPLRRDRPLWELWIADRLPDGRIGIVGKAHHCMVDGIAVLQLGNLLLDTTPEYGRRANGDGAKGDGAAPPAPSELLLRGVRDRLRDQVGLAAGALTAAGSPSGALRMARTLANAVLPLSPDSPLNRPGSPRRHLATARRPLDDLRRVKRRWSTTMNDVLLAATGGAIRRFMARRGEDPPDLKAMVPVNVRDPDADGPLGNRISFMFVALPCGEPDPLLRLMAVHRETAVRKRQDEPAEADALMRALGLAPRTIRHAAARLVASPRMFNLVVSNIPGPRRPMYLRGCRLRAAYPVVPLADKHALAVGMTTIGDQACVGLYADRETLPDADALARDFHAEMDELLAMSDPYQPTA